MTISEVEMQNNTQWQTSWQERRLCQTPREGDVRSPWDRDYARIIHSAAFRRLQSKTQIIDPGQSDFYRTRLTHSLEVSQVSYGILHYLKEKYRNHKIADVLPETRLLAAICLSHDLGHPPYGHGGETALNFCMREYGGFEGNGQTIRILSSLEQYTEKHGLNPTRRLLFGVLKYPVCYSKLVNLEAYNSETPNPRWLFHAKEQLPPKCYHDTESEIIDWLLDPLGNARDEFCKIKKTSSSKKHNSSIHKSLDASIMDISDDISYGLHDLEDSIAMGMLTREMWEEYIDIEKQDIFKNYGFTATEVADDIFSTAEYRRKERIGGMIHYLITHTYIEETGIESDCPLVIYKARFEDDAADFQKLMGDLVFDLIISSSNIQMFEFKGRKIVTELFDVFKANPDKLLPYPIRKIFDEQKNEVAQMRVLCDYIASMTDVSAARLHEKLFFAGKGSVFDKF